MTVVLDASALVAYLLEAKTKRTIADVIENSGELPWTLPLVDAEVGNSLRRAVAQRRMAEPRAAVALERLARMPMVRTGHVSLFPAAWRLRHNLTFYDALYVSLAARVDATLITLDKRLAAAPRLPAKVLIPQPS